MTSCPSCGSANPETARFCSNCGIPLKVGSDATSTISIKGLDVEAEAEAGAGLEPSALDALPVGSALLVVRRGPNSGNRYLLDGEVTTAGRHPESDIFLDDVTVSRRHAEFLREGGVFSVRDVGSLDGTYVNRERIDAAVLSGGDEVQIGKYRLVFYAAAPVPAARPARDG